MTSEDIGVVGRPELLARIISDQTRAWNDIPVFVTRQVHQLWGQVLSDAGDGAPEVLEFDAIHGIKTLVLGGRGVTLTPVGLFSSEIAADELAVGKIAGLDMSRPLIIAWSSVRPHPRALEAVAAALAEEVVALAARGVFTIASPTAAIAIPRPKAAPRDRPSS